MTKRNSDAQRGWSGKGLQDVKSQAFDKCLALETDQGMQAFGYYTRLLNSIKSLPIVDHLPWEILVHLMEYKLLFLSKAI